MTYERIVYIDFETRSEKDVKEVGAHAYNMHPSTEMILVSYAFGSDPVKVCEQMPDNVYDAIEDPTILKIAHNAEFDMAVCKYVLGIDITPSDWLDTAYMAAYYGYPRALGFVAHLLGCKAKASPEEMYLFSIPVQIGAPAPDDEWFAQPTYTRYNRKEDFPEDWERFLIYAMADVEVMREIHERMRELPAIEIATMHATFEMNFNGCPFDVKFASEVWRRSQEYSERAGVEAKERFGIENLRSPIQVKDALRMRGIRLESLDVKKRGNVTHPILDLRDQASGSAFSKIPTALKRLCPDGRLHGEFLGYGAHTGRWSSRGTQLHNWARIKTQVSTDLTKVESYDHLRQHMRLCLGYDGINSFTYGDLSQIEARIVAWLADCKWRIAAFKNGEDIYARSAERIFQLPHVTKDMEERFLGKTYELALGFGGGHSAVQRMKPEFYETRGANKVMEEVQLWRQANPEIVNAWYRVQRAWLEACKTGVCRIQLGSVFMVFQYDGKTIRVTLPSGHALFYRGMHLQPKDWGGPDIYYLDYSEQGEHSKRIKLWGGSIFQNIVQAIARDVITEVVTRVIKREPSMKPVGTVHDELWFLHKTSLTNALNILLEEMERSIPWAPGLITAGEGFTSDRYRK